MEFRWLGVAGIELRVGEYILAIDPFLTRPLFRRMWLGRVQPDQALIAAKIPRCNTILVSHAHFDHLMDVPEVIKNTGAVALGSENTCRLLALLGVPGECLRQIRAGDKLSLDPFRIEVLPAVHIRVPGFSPGPLRKDLHPPLRLHDYRMDDSFCFLLQAAGLRLLAWSSERSETALPADVVFLGLTRKKAYLDALLSRVRPRVVIPIHWDDLFRPLSKPIRPFFEPPRLAFPPLRRMNLDEFRRVVDEIAPGTKVLIPEISRLYEMQTVLE